MKPDALRIMGWVIPLLCMAIAGWTLLRDNQELGAASDATKQAHRINEEKAKEKSLYDHQEPMHRYAAVDDVPLEETAFLNDMRTRMAADHVTFERWMSQSIEYGKDKLAVKMDDKTAALLKGIRRIGSTLTLTGSYGDIRKFLGELESSDRLFTLTNLTWNAAKEGTILTMTVSRYVAPPAPVQGSKTKTPTLGVTSTP